MNDYQFEEKCYTRREVADIIDRIREEYRAITIIQRTPTHDLMLQVHEAHHDIQGTTIIVT